MSVYDRDNTSRTRLRDTNIDPVHGQNPDYYAETSSATGRNQPQRPRAKMSAHNRDSDQKYEANSTASRHPESDHFDREEMHLEPYPGSPHGPRSIPPTADNAMQPRGRDHSRSDSFASSSTISVSPTRYRNGPHDQHNRGLSPMARARGIVSDNFSGTPTGIGAGILGAVVGGIIANQASNAASKHKHGSNPNARRSKSDDRARMLSTLAGAVVGGLGANAVANRVQHHHERNAREKYSWNGRGGGGDFQEESFEKYRSRSRPGSRGEGTRSGSRGWQDDEKQGYFLREESEKGGRRRDEDEYDFVNDEKRREDGHR